MFLDIKEYKKLYLDSKEEIKDSYLKEFFLTNISQKNLKLTAKSNIIYFYISTIHKYYIILVDENINNSFFEEELLKNISSNELTLYILENSFCLYENGDLIYLKDKNPSSTDEDIINYVNKFLKLTPNKIHNIDNKKLNNLKKDFKKPKHRDISYINIYSSKKAIIFLSYILLLVIVLSVVLFSKKNDDKILSISKQNIANKIENIFNDFSNFEIKQIDMENNVLIYVSFEDKDRFLEFLKNKNYKLKQIQYDEIKSNYEAIISK